MLSSLSMAHRFHILGPHMGFDPGSSLGGERFEASWMRAMDNQDFQFTWLMSETPSYAGFLSINHRIRLIARKSGLARVLTEVFELRKIIKRERVDMIRFHSVRYGVPVALVLRMLANRTMFLFQHHHVEQPRFLYAIFLRLAQLLGARFCTVSEFARQELLRSGIAAERVGLVLSILPTPLESVSIQQKTYDFCFVGSLIERKRPYLLLELASQIKDRTLRIAIVGKGKLYPALEQRIEKLSHGIQFFTQADDAKKNAILRASRIFFFPSTQEGFGYAPLEAAFSGCWVVAARAGALPEILKDFPQVKLFSDEDLASGRLRELCVDLLSMDPPAASVELADFWTSYDRFRCEHERMLKQILST